MSPSRRFAFPPPVGMIDRIHNHPANLGPPSKPARPARLSKNHVAVIGITDLPQGSPTLDRDFANFAGGHPQLRPAFVPGHELNPDSCTTGKTCALPGIQLDIVNCGPNWDPRQGQSIPNSDRSLRPRIHQAANLQPLRSEDVSLFPVTVEDQGNECGAIRIVFYRRHLPFHPILVTLEVYNPVASFVTTSATTHRDAASVVAPPAFR